jgi:hypothetical protein
MIDGEKQPDEEQWSGDEVAAHCLFHVHNAIHGKDVRVNYAATLVVPWIAGISGLQM